MHTTTKALAQLARHEWQRAGTTHDVEPGDPGLGGCILEVERGLRGRSKNARESLKAAVYPRTEALEIIRNLQRNGLRWSQLTERRKIDREAARTRPDGLFDRAALDEQGAPPRVGWCKHDRGFFEGQLGQHAVEVVTTEFLHACRRNHLVPRSSKANECGIKRSAPQIVNGDVLAATVQCVRVTMRELDPGRTRFVDETQHVEARSSNASRVAQRWLE